MVESRGASSRASARRRACRTRLACLAIGVLVAVVSGAVTSPAAAQQADDEVRIVARKLDNGKIEFALQQRRADASWGDRQLPSKRLFPATATVGSWLQSTPLTMRVPAAGGTSAADVAVRIVARKLDNGKVEFALQQRRADASWGDRQLPSKRLFPATATVGRWLQSTPISVTVTSATPAETPVATEDQTMPIDGDAWEEGYVLLDIMSACQFDTQTGECRRIIDGWNADKLIQAAEDFWGNGCDYEFATWSCRDWTDEDYLHSSNERYCPERWYFTVNDMLCHSTPQ